MKIVKVELTKADLEDADAGEPCPRITLELMEYEVQELMNQERDRIERGLSVADTRVAVGRYDTYRLALNKAAEAKRR